MTLRLADRTIEQLRAEQVDSGEARRPKANYGVLGAVSRETGVRAHYSAHAPLHAASHLRTRCSALAVRAKQKGGGSPLGYNSPRSAKETTSAPATMK